MQFSFFQLHFLLILSFFNFQKVQALPFPTNNDSIEIIIEVSPSPSTTSNSTSDDPRKINIPTNSSPPHSFSPRTHFCAQPSNENSTQDSISRTLVSDRRKKLNQIQLALQSKGLGLGKGLGIHSGLIFETKMKPITIAFHVLFDERNGNGNVTDDSIKSQIQTLNQDYFDTGFSFELGNVTRTGNSTLFNQGEPGGFTEIEMKKSLHQGDASTLNVYSVSFQDNLLGYSTWPWDYESDMTNDGVVFLYSTLPGGSAQDYNQGKTLVHETGHFLGLYHTFQGGCNSPGDEVDDTAPQANPTSGCPLKRDTCNSDNLEDPIHNYMDYSVDECLTGFTAGQAVRMSAISSHYRGL